MKPESQQQQQKRKMGRPRKFSEEFRQQALERMKMSGNVTALVPELGVRRKWLYGWRMQASGAVPESRPSSKSNRTVEDRERKRIAELEHLVARQALEIDFFKSALQHRGKSPEASRMQFKFRTRPG